MFPPSFITLPVINVQTDKASIGEKQRLHSHNELKQYGFIREKSLFFLLLYWQRPLSNDVMRSHMRTQKQKK